MTYLNIGILSLTENQEKWVDIIIKKLVASNNVSDGAGRSLKAWTL